MMYHKDRDRQVSLQMDKLKFGVAAGIFAMLGTAVTQLIQLTFIESAVATAAIEGLFVGAVTYLGIKALRRSADSQ